MAKYCISWHHIAFFCPFLLFKTTGFKKKMFAEILFLNFTFSSKIRNIVSTVNLGCKLDLKTIALRARNAEYNPKVWPCKVTLTF